MVLGSLLGKIKQKGVAMVEYAVLLAFVAVVAGVFMDGDGLKGGIQGSVDKVLAVFDLAGEKESKYKDYNVNAGYGWLLKNGVLQNFAYNATDNSLTNGDKGWLPKVTSGAVMVGLNDGEGTYKIEIDYQAMVDYLKNTGISVNETDLKDYFTGKSDAGQVNIGLFATKEDGSLASGTFKSKGTVFGDPGDSRERDMQYLAGQTDVKYYTFATTASDGKTSLGYNIINKDVATAQDATYQAYNKALINAGLTVSKM